MVLYPYTYIQLTPWFPLSLVSGLVTKLCPTLETPWTIAHQDPLSMQFLRQEYRSGLPFLSPEDIPNPGIKPESPALQADSLPTELPGKPHCPNQALLCPCVFSICCL